MLERAARDSEAAPAFRLRTCLWAATSLKEVRGEGGARRGPSVARPWGVGRGEQILLREHRRSAPRVFTVPNELTNECLWGGSAPPNGSRLSCGRLAHRRKSTGRTSRARQGTTQRLPLKRERPSASSAC